MIKLEEMNEETKNKIKEFCNFMESDLIVEIDNAMTKKMNSKENEPYNIAYNNIVKRTAQFLKNELKINDQILLSIIFDYLLWNGYFSKDKNFEFSISNRICNFSALGADIMLGKSVCLNNAFMLTDTLNSMDYEAYVLGCDIKYNRPKDFKFEDILGYDPGIKRKIVNKEDLTIKLVNLLAKVTPIKNVGNHAAVVFNYNGMYYIKDPTNLCFLNFTDFLKANIPGTELNYTIKPFITSFLSSLTTKELEDLMIKIYIHTDQKQAYLTKDIITNLYSKTIDMCKKNRFLLDDFHDENINDIDIVCKTLKKK